MKKESPFQTNCRRKSASSLHKIVHNDALGAVHLLNIAALHKTNWVHCIYVEYHHAASSLYISESIVLLKINVFEIFEAQNFDEKVLIF